jgi:hypothetical protein
MYTIASQTTSKPRHDPAHTLALACESARALPSTHPSSHPPTSSRPLALTYIHLYARVRAPKHYGPPLHSLLVTDRTHTHTHTHTRARARGPSHTRIHPHTQAHIYTHMNSLTSAHTVTHMCADSPARISTPPPIHTGAQTLWCGLTTEVPAGKSYE